MSRHGSEAVRDAIAGSIVALPSHLRRSLSWDQGAEMARHADLKILADLPIYFCDPQSALKSRTPMQAMKDRHKSHPHRFVKSPRNQAGRDR